MKSNVDTPNENTGPLGGLGLGKHVPPQFSTVFVVKLGLRPSGSVITMGLVRRTTEFGVRLALGARPADVTGDVLRGVFGQVLLGIGVGLPIALVAVRASEGLLFGMTSSEPWSYQLAAAVLGTIAGLAAWIPARRAASVDPCRALRQQ